MHKCINVKKNVQLYCQITHPNKTGIHSENIHIFKRIARQKHLDASVHANFFIIHTAS